jgi:transposase-like protein
MRKPKKFFDEKTKRQAVDDYVSGRRSAQEVADSLGIRLGMIYKWRVQLDERDKGARIEELEEKAQVSPEAAARMIADLQAEIVEYQKKLAEQTVIADLLKKRLHSKSSQERSELTGLIETLERAAQKRGRAK